MTVLDDTPNQLEEIVREHLEWNRLPAIVSRQVKAGYGGVGAKCEVCGSEIELQTECVKLLGPRPDSRIR
jgi:hypothetical protein